MKKAFIVFMLILNSQAFAAIGCLPGDCCNGRPCGNPPESPKPNPPRPTPGCLTDNAFLLKTAVESCISCSESEVCAEYRNSIGEVLGYSCLK